jgi:hypothetical protein
MITRQQFDEACAQKDAAEKRINAYLKQEADDFKARWERFDKHNEFFTDEELIYSAGARCDKCGEGLAYPKKCDHHHQWTCAAVLKGVGTDKGHSAFPFAFYEIKSEQQPSAYGATTRPKPATEKAA